MRLTMFRTTLVPTLLAVTITLAGCSNDNDMPSNHGATGPDASSTAADQFNDADIMFAQDLIPHHDQAVNMSDMVLSKTGVHPEVTALAMQIKAAQQPEIDTMNTWLDAWGRKEFDDDGKHHGGAGGLMTEDEMRRLDKANGREGQRLYLEGMIKHHEGAITMAKIEIASGKNPGAIKLAESIAESQQQEIDTMTALLTKL
jgi:uncharacterized protein (DUF305 family)